MFRTWYGWSSRHKWVSRSLAREDWRAERALRSPPRAVKFGGALLSVMVYSVARVSAVVGMRVEDYYQQGKRWWLRLQEKGSKHHAVRTPAGVVYCLTGTSSTWLGWMTLDDRPFER